MGVLALLTFAFGAVPHAFPRMRLPLAGVEGMAVVDGRAYIASRDSGRVLEYDLQGRLAKWTQMPKRPISLTIQDGRLVVRYSGGERVLEAGLPGISGED